MTPDELTAYLKYLKEEFGIELEDFTCHSCNLKEACSYAYDGYNTDGDCLALK